MHRAWLTTCSHILPLAILRNRHDEYYIHFTDQNKTLRELFACSRPYGCSRAEICLTLLHFTRVKIWTSVCLPTRWYSTDCSKLRCQICWIHSIELLLRIYSAPFPHMHKQHSLLTCETLQVYAKSSPNYSPLPRQAALCMYICHFAHSIPCARFSLPHIVCLL